MADGHKYFEIKEIKDVITMLDISISDVKASDWKDVWCGYTAKQRASGLLWGVVILTEKFEEDTKNYFNTLMFDFSHSCFDGVSSAKFCKQFLGNINKLANGTSSVDEEISSLDFLPFHHDIVIRERFWHSIFNFMMTYSGLRSIFKFFMQKMLFRWLETKPDNPYYVKFPTNIDDSKSLVQGSQLDARVFTENETKIIIQACKVNHCTVTGAVMAAAHLCFCELVQDDKFHDVDLQSLFAVESRRFCDPKPHEDYFGLFVYVCQDVYMKYAEGVDVDFWKLARESSQRIKDCVKKQKFVAESTMAGGMMNVREHIDIFKGDKFFPLKSCCNLISSYGCFNFTDQSSVNTFKLNNCFLNSLVHNSGIALTHYIHTIDGKMTWNIVSDVKFNIEHFKKFSNLCFTKLNKMSAIEN